jgi:hypothetical protein
VSFGACGSTGQAAVATLDGGGMSGTNVDSDYFVVFQ